MWLWLFYLTVWRFPFCRMITLTCSCSTSICDCLWKGLISRCRIAFSSSCYHKLCLWLHALKGSFMFLLCFSFLFSFSSMLMLSMCILAHTVQFFPRWPCAMTGCYNLIMNQLPPAEKAQVTANWSAGKTQNSDSHMYTSPYHGPQLLTEGVLFFSALSSSILGLYWFSLLSCWWWKKCGHLWLSFYKDS